MPDLSKNINGKKFMWDNVVYESKKEAQDLMEKYKKDNFEVELITISPLHKKSRHRDRFGRRTPTSLNIGTFPKGTPYNFNSLILYPV